MTNCIPKLFVTEITNILSYLSAKVYFGKDPAGVPCNSFIFFPCRQNILCCGLAGIVSFKREKKPASKIDHGIY